MKKSTFIQLLCITLISASLGWGTATAQIEARHYRTQDFKGTWGVRILLPTAYDLAFPDGSGVNAENFDIDLFMEQIDQLETISHVHINIGRGHQASWYSSPYPEMENIMGSDLFPKRDFFGEMVAALRARNLKVIVYFSCTGMDDGYLTKAQMNKWNAHLAANNLTHFEGVTQILRYYSVKYGDKIDAWWIDRAARMSTAEHRLYAEAIREGNPDAMIAFHIKVGIPIRQGTQFCDYTAGHPPPVKTQVTWTPSNVGMVENIEAGPWITTDGTPDDSEGTALGAILMPFQAKWRDGAANFPTSRAIEWTERAIAAGGMYSWAGARVGNGFALPQFNQFLEIDAAIKAKFGDIGGNNGGGNEDTTNDNLALGGTATQSTTLNNAFPSRAIDGDTSGNFSSGSVTAAQGPEAWWQVDLGSDQDIETIKIFNRTDACCTDRLSDFTIYITDSDGTTTYTKTITGAPGQTVAINAIGAVGKVVRIASNSGSTLNLAEVQVFAPNTLSTNVPNSPKNMFRIYPNPMQDRLVIDKRESKAVQYIIFDTTGKIVFKDTLGHDQTTIDSSGLSKGLYLIKISNGSGTFTERLIKK